MKTRVKSNPPQILITLINLGIKGDEKRSKRYRINEISSIGIKSKPSNKNKIPRL